jgi:hypothetical protein
VCAVAYDVPSTIECALDGVSGLILCDLGRLGGVDAPMPRKACAPSVCVFAIGLKFPVTGAAVFA